MASPQKASNLLNEEDIIGEIANKISARVQKYSSQTKKNHIVTKKANCLDSKSASRYWIVK